MKITKNQEAKEGNRNNTKKKKEKTMIGILGFEIKISYLIVQKKIKLSIKSIKNITNFLKNKFIKHEKQDY